MRRTLPTANRAASSVAAASSRRLPVGMRAGLGSSQCRRDESGAQSATPPVCRRRPRGARRGGGGGGAGGGGGRPGGAAAPRRDREGGSNQRGQGAGERAG